MSAERILKKWTGFTRNKDGKISKYDSKAQTTGIQSVSKMKRTRKMKDGRRQTTLVSSHGMMILGSNSEPNLKKTLKSKPKKGPKSGTGKDGRLWNSVSSQLIRGNFLYQFGGTGNVLPGEFFNQINADGTGRKVVSSSNCLTKIVSEEGISKNIF